MGVMASHYSDRQCSRAGCAEAAVATLTYQYGQAHVWIDELSDERDPHTYDLCERHAARVSPPQGWRIDDRRRSRTSTSLIA